MCRVLRSSREMRSDGNVSKRRDKAAFFRVSCARRGEGRALRGHGNFTVILKAAGIYKILGIIFKRLP